MKHLFRVEKTKDGVMLTLAIQLSKKEAKEKVTHYASGTKSNPETLLQDYNYYGLSVLLAMLRSYIDHFENETPAKKPKRRKKKK